MSHDPPKPTSAPIKKPARAPHRAKSKNAPSEAKKARGHKNRKHAYPPGIALRNPGFKRKAYIDNQYADLQTDVDASRTSGDKHEIARAELLLARSIVPKDSFREEPELMGTAFVPYRFRSAYERTEHFARIFDKLYREYSASPFGKVIEAPPRKNLSLWPDSDIIALWHARQHADYLGVPYEFYLRQAFKYRLWSGYKRCPMPNQMWHGKVLQVVSDEYQRHGGRHSNTSYFEDPIHPMFYAENYREHPIQIAAHLDLIGKTKQFPDFFKVGSLILARKLLPEDIARSHLSDRTVDVAISNHSSLNITRPDTVPLGPEEVPLLGCFGTYHPAAMDCPTCPHQSACRDMQHVVDTAMIAKHGTADPRRTETAKDATERKRRQRQRERHDRAATKAAPGGGDEPEHGVGLNPERDPGCEPDV
ncbi:hypothetical protein ACYX7E_14735 [Luteimonas sp. RIT-PG2_3]